MSIAFKFRHPKTKEEKFVYFSDRKIYNLLSEEAHEHLTCDCQPECETYVVECNCCDYLCDFELLDFEESMND